MPIPQRFGDNPITKVDDDHLARGAVCKSLADLLGAEQLDLPLTLGIYGDWGSGKTSMLHLVQRHLDADTQTLTIWFNAWAYAQQQDALWRALLLALIAHFRDEDFQQKLFCQENAEASCKKQKQKSNKLRKELDTQLEQLETSLYRSKSYRQQEGVDVNYQAVMLLVVRAVARMLPLVGTEAAKSLEKLFAEGQDVKDLFNVLSIREREELREHVRSIEQFKLGFQQFIQRFISQTKKRLVIFIDDLDRCLPEQAISVLEAIKIFFDSNDGKAMPCIFVLGMDRRIIEDGLKLRYHTIGEGLIDARSYLDKIIQIPFSIPPLDEKQIGAFAEKWCEGMPDLQQCTTLITKGVAANPRSVKRTLNILALMYTLRQASGRSDDVDKVVLQRLTKLIIIQTSYDEVYHKIVQDTELLRQLELASRGAASSSYTRETGPILERHQRLAEMLRLEPQLPDNAQDARKVIENLLYAVPLIPNPIADSR